MREQKDKSRQAKHSTPGKTDRSTTRTTSHTSPDTTDPPPISPMVRMHQQKVLAAVSILFEDVSGHDYITHLNALLVEWVFAKRQTQLWFDADATSDIIYRVTNLVNFMSKLQGLTDYTFEDILQGGSISQEELLEGLL